MPIRTRYTNAEAIAAVEGEATLDLAGAVSVAQLLTAKIGRTATYVVAASNAPAHVKAQADYVCDGVADNEEIQAAIDALPAGGGKVLLSEGAFNIAASLTLDTYVTLGGQGGSTILKAANALNTYIIGPTYPSGGIVRNLTVDGNRVNQTIAQWAVALLGNYCCVENIYIHDVLGGGLYMDNTGGSISNVRVEDVSSTGIFVSSLGLYFKVRNIETHNCGGGSFIFSGVYSSIDGVRCSGTSGTNNIHSHIEIWGSNNHLSHIVVIGGNCTGIIPGGSNITLDSFLIYQSFGSGIDLATTGKNNTIQNGIILEAGYSAAASERFGITVPNLGGNIIQGVFISKSAWEGICLWDSSNNTIRGNILINNGQSGTNGLGIYIRTTPASYNLIQGNKAYDDQAVKTQLYGLQEGGGGQTPDYNIIVDNDFRGNSTGGISLISGAYSKAQRNQGYVTENSDTASITGAVNSVDVTHGLAATPTRVFIQAQQGGQGDYWVSAKGALTFTISFTTQPGGSTWTFDWRAQVGEG